MIPIIQKEIVDKKKWVNEIELLDIIAISESTPGPIAVNASTFVGYKIGGFFGALFSLLGLIIPSFIILLIISFFYKEFLALEIVSKAFMGLKVGVIVLLFNAFIKLKKMVKFTLLNYITFFIVLTLMILDTILNLQIPSLSIILIALGLIIGIVSELITSKINKEGRK